MKIQKQTEKKKVIRDFYDNPSEYLSMAEIRKNRIQLYKQESQDAQELNDHFGVRE